MKSLPLLLGSGCLLASAWVSSAPPGDGGWRLEIDGHHTYYFGERVLGGGVRIPWEVVIDFQVERGSYLRGHGKARWLDRLAYPSVPEAWIDCGLVHGTYLDRNLKLRETPWIRYPAFPVAGALSDGRLTLSPAYEPPGNYLAVTFQCETRNPIATNWFVFAERAKNEEGKRQDYELTEEHPLRRARIRQVKTLPPAASMEMPLRDGWTFVQGSEADRQQVRYRLHRLD